MKLDYFEELWANQDEVITHSYVQDVRLPSGKILALLTLDNGKEQTFPKQEILHPREPEDYLLSLGTLH
jgi:hypothetical protein